MSDSATPWTAACPASLSFTISQSLLKLMSTESVMLSNHLILCHPLLLLPSIFPSIEVFSNESVLCTRWPKYWSFSFSISLPHEYLGLISSGLTGLISDSQESSPEPQFKHQFFSTQPSLWCNSPIYNDWKNHSFDYITLCPQSDVFVFNTSSRFIIAFLPRRKCILITWLQSLFTVILEPKKRKSVTASTFSPSVCQEVLRPDAMILVF